MALLPRRCDDLDPARGVIAAPLLILALAVLAWILFVLAWPVLASAVGALAAWRRGVSLLGMVLSGRVPW